MMVGTVGKAAPHLTNRAHSAHSHPPAADVTGVSTNLPQVAHGTTPLLHQRGVAHEKLHHHPRARVTHPGHLPSSEGRASHPGSVVSGRGDLDSVATVSPRQARRAAPLYEPSLRHSSSALRELRVQLDQAAQEIHSSSLAHDMETRAIEAKSRREAAAHQQAAADAREQATALADQLQASQNRLHSQDDLLARSMAERAAMSDELLALQHSLSHAQAASAAQQAQALAASQRSADLEAELTRVKAAAEQTQRQATQDRASLLEQLEAARRSMTHERQTREADIDATARRADAASVQLEEALAANNRFAADIARLKEVANAERARAAEREEEVMQARRRISRLEGDLQRGASCGCAPRSARCSHTHPCPSQQPPLSPCASRSSQRRDKRW